MSIHAVLSRADNRGSASVIKSRPRASETLSTGGAASTIAAQDDEVWLITARADVYVSFGAAPDGTGSSRFFLPSGAVYPFAASASGEKVAYSLT